MFVSLRCARLETRLLNSIPSDPQHLVRCIAYHWLSMPMYLDATIVLNLVLPAEAQLPLDSFCPAAPAALRGLPLDVQRAGGG